MRILVTGISGFIGSAFARLALDRGNQVAGLVRPTSELPLELVNVTGLRLLRGTLQETPWAEVEKFRPDVTVHGAWLTKPGVYLESPENLELVEASVSFARKLRELGSRHLVVLGTCFEYKPIPEPLKEETSPIEPGTVYARAKNELRLRLEAEAQRDPFSLCWARVFYPYGPGEHSSRLCTSIANKLRKGEAIRLKTPQSTKDYIYIEDLAEAILTVVQSGFAGRINLGTGTAVQVREVANTIASLLGKRELVSEADPPEPDPLPWVVADSTRLRGLGWQPKVGLQLGLKTLLADILR